MHAHVSLAEKRREVVEVGAREMKLLRESDRRRAPA
jgi:hypothetical protein